LLEINSRITIGGTQGDRDHREAISQPERPEIGHGPSLSPADQNRIIADGAICQRNRPASAQEVDLHEVDRTIEKPGAFGEILLSITSAPLVRRATEFKDRDKFSTETVPDFQKWHSLDILCNEVHLRRSVQYPSRCPTP